MRALTLKHPWPYAICKLGKRIENRNWAPPASLLVEGQWFAIHGGAEPKGQNLIEAKAALRQMRVNGLAADTSRIDYAITFTGIVAVCRYAGFVTTSDDPWFSGLYGWKLADLVVLPNRIPCRGAQGLWDVPNQARLSVEQQLPEGVIHA